MLDKFHKLFSLTGIRNDVLPGIRIAFFPVYAMFIQFREALLTGLGLGDVNPVTAYILLAIGTVLGGVLLWAISGYILDPVYNFLYSYRGLWTRTPGRKFGIFQSGYDLDQFRRLAREELAKHEPVYKDSEVSIHKPVREKMRAGDAELYKKVEAELENSKSFRNAILPILFLGGWFIYNQAVVPALVTFVALIALLELSFRGRAEHALKAYRWSYTNLSGSK